MADERMTIDTVDVCKCELVMHQGNPDDYDTLGSDSGVCCPNCGNENFQTVKQLLNSEKEQVEDLGETLTNAIKEMPEGYKLKCHAARHGDYAVLDFQAIPNDQEFDAFGRPTESPNPTAKQTIMVNPEEMDADVVDCPLADQDCYCGLANGGAAVSCKILEDRHSCPLNAGPVEVSLAAKK